MKINPFLIGGAAFLLWRAVDRGEVGPMDAKRAFVLAIWDASQEAAARVGWPRDLIITAAAHESNYGKSALASKYHNLFGYKANAAWFAAKKPVALLPTWEEENGKVVHVNAPFRVYPSWKESIDDYVDLITRLSRYASADAAAKRGDARGFFDGLQRGGYATDSRYAEKLDGVHRSIEAALV